MKKKIAIVLFVFFFLAQAVLITSFTAAEGYTPNPLTEIKTGAQNAGFKGTCSFLLTALSLYKSDVFEKLPKSKLIELYTPVIMDPNLRFDLEHIDLMKKGWTRYYPFSVGQKSMIVRIFLTSEASFQPELPVISEITIEDIGVTLQVLPGIGELLKDRSIKPDKIYSPAPNYL